MLKFQIEITIDMENGQVNSEGGVMADKATANYIDQEHVADTCKSLDIILRQAAQAFYSLTDNSVKDDLDTEILEGVVVASGMLDKIMTRMNNLMPYIQNHDIVGALQADPGFLMASLDMFENDKDAATEKPVPDEETARRRAIMVMHPDAGS